MTFDEDHTAFGSEKFPDPRGSPANLTASPALPAAHQHDQAKPTRRIKVHAPSRRQHQPRPRTKYTDEEKAKIQQVRRQRACLRCKMLRIRCSMENPCLPCLSSAAKGSERKVLSFCYCVRTRYVDVNIFDGQQQQQPGEEEHQHQQQQQQQQQAGSAEMNRAVADIVARMHAPALPNPDNGTFEDLVIRWLTEPAFQLPNGSVVAALCATECLSQLNEAVDESLVADFRTFLFAASAAHTGCVRRGIGPHELVTASRAAGSKIIQRLDRILSPQHLGRCGDETVRALLLLVLGMILGVGYSARQTRSPAFPHGVLLPHHLQQSPTLWMTMREHLCQMLAHHLIFLGSLIGIRLDTGVEQYIIDKAINGWNKVGSNIWADALTPFVPISDHVSSSTPSSSSLIDLQQLQQQSPISGHHPPPPPPPPPVVAVACPDIASLPHPETLGENPDSYLSMTDEDIKPLVPRDLGYVENPMAQFPNSPPYGSDPPGGVPQRQIKRRSVWVVRPFDAGPQGIVNVHARFRIGEGQSIGLFA